MTHKEHNGWYNYETWLTALWIDNEEGTYHQRQEMAEEAVKEADNDKAAALYPFSKALRSWVEEEMIPDLGASLASDFLGAALSEVNFEEIAENWLEEVEIEEDESEESPEASV